MLKEAWDAIAGCSVLVPPNSGPPQWRDIRFISWKELGHHEEGLTREVISYCTPREIYHLSIATGANFVANTILGDTESYVYNGMNPPKTRTICLLEQSHLNTILVATLAHRVTEHSLVKGEDIPAGPCSPRGPVMRLDNILPPLKKSEVPRVIMSGSLPLQALVNYNQVMQDNLGYEIQPTGVIDLFCVQSHVEQVRNVLVGQYDMICCGFYNVENMSSSPVDHVETYSYRPRNYSAKKLDTAMHNGYKEYKINFPLDEDLDCIDVRIFVAKKRVTNPYNLIQTFDINASRVAFDGRVFTLPWESNIFAWQARLMTSRASMQTFLDSHLQGHPLVPCYIRCEDDCDEFHVLVTIHRIWKFMARGFVFEGLPDLFVHLANHSVGRNWLVLDPTRLRSVTSPIIPVLCAPEYACPNLCGAACDNHQDYEWHCQTCTFNPLDWPNANGQATNEG